MTLASTTGVVAYDQAFQASLGLYQSDLATAAYDAANFAGNTVMTPGLALQAHLLRVIAAGRLYGVNIDGVANQLNQQFGLFA